MENTKPNGSQPLFCVKMRASRSGLHISGAERIVAAADVPKTAAALARRAMSHPNGRPDAVKVKALAVERPLVVPALPVRTVRVASPGEGWRLVEELLAADGVARAGELRGLFRETFAMRGAALVDADTLERLEPDRARGVRSTCMDAADGLTPPSAKDHFSEALVLATKVQHAPGIVGEICVSDDPGYVTGYVASKSLGYVRITALKEKNDPCGGRIFLYRGPRAQIAGTIEFLESRPVLVTDMVSPPRDTAEPPESFFRRANDERKAAGLWRTCRVLASPTGPVASVGGRDVVVLASNDYLDLARDARVAEAAARAARDWGAGSGGSRLTTGTQPPHVALERRIAAFKGAEDAVLFATGYMANLGVVSALAGKGDAVVSDALNHASIIDGCRLSGAEVFVYPHLDMDALAQTLARCRAFRRVVAVSDAVFSMDGDILDLPRFLDICRRHGAISVIDEAHATGVMGATGRGLAEHFGCGHADVTVGTFSKALGAEGAFASGSAAMADYLRNNARPFIFSTAPGAPAVAAAAAALDILEAEPERVARLRENAAFFAAELNRLGVAAKTDSAIVPVHVGDERRAVALSEKLLDEGFLIPAIRYPTVARGTARLRAAVMSAHTRGQLSAAARAIAEAAG